MSNPKERDRGPLPPDSMESGVRSLKSKFPELSEAVIRNSLEALNRSDIRINQYLTALAVRDLSLIRRNHRSAD